MCIFTFRVVSHQYVVVSGRVVSNKWGFIGRFVYVYCIHITHSIFANASIQFNALASYACLKTYFWGYHDWFLRENIIPKTPIIGVKKICADFRRLFYSKIKIYFASDVSIKTYAQIRQNHSFAIGSKKGTLTLSHPGPENFWTLCHFTSPKICTLLCMWTT